MIRNQLHPETAAAVGHLQMLCDRLIDAALAPTGGAYRHFTAAQNCLAQFGGRAPYASQDAAIIRHPDELLEALLKEMHGYGQVFMADGAPHPGLEEAVGYLVDKGLMETPPPVSFDEPEAYFTRIEELIASATEAPELADVAAKARRTVDDCLPGGRFTREELPPAGAPNYVLERTLIRAIEELSAALDAHEEQVKALPQPAI